MPNRHLAVPVLALLLAAGLARAALVPRDAVPDGPCPDDEPVPGLILVLPLRDAAGLESLLQAQLDPASPSYRRWIDPDEFGRRFGASDATWNAALGWLASNGFSRIDALPGRFAIRFDATAGGIARAFGTRLRAWTMRGARRLAPAGDPVLPAFAGVRPISIVGLDGFVGLRTAQRLSGRTFLAPPDLWTVYGLGAVHAAGITGSGVTIAVPAASDFDLADVALFRRNGTLPAGAIVKHFVGAQTITGGDALTEALIDVEWSGALAPEATIVAVIGAGDLTNGINGALTEAITKNLAPIVSVSYGVCELFGSPVAAFYDTLFKQAAAQGQSVLVASGDTGVTGCAPDNLARSVDVLAASPWVTGVGGTQLDPLFDADGNATGWGGEVVWNDSGASGGGVSTIFRRPTWQTGPGVPPGVMRVVPDVAFPASSSSPGFVIAIGGRGTTVGGTSVGAPVWASLVALMVQQKGRLGLLNPELYRLGALQAGGGPAVFHDVVQGTNGFGAVSGFVAGPGYDAATGWGSFDAPALLTAFTASCADARACDDGNPCTIDRCTPDGCRSEVAADGTSCTSTSCLTQQCSGGTCVTTDVPVTCDDGDPCTEDTCSGGCTIRGVRGDAAVTCVLAVVPGCAGETVPAGIRQRLRQARTLLARTVTWKHRRRSKLLRQAGQRLAQADRAARRSRRLSEGCRTALVDGLGEASARVARLRTLP